MIFIFMHEENSLTIKQACSLVSESHFVLFLKKILKYFDKSMYEILVLFLGGQFLEKETLLKGSLQGEPSALEHYHTLLSNPKDPNH